MYKEQNPVLLLVDDEEDIRENLRDYVEFKGYDVLEACNGVQALECIEKEKPDLILSDLMMPKMGGQQLLKELITKENQIPVVIMTAFGTMEYAIDAMKNGASDFLTKPIDLEYMIKVIERTISRSQLEQKIKEQQRQLDEDVNHAAFIQSCLLPQPIETNCFSLHFKYKPLIGIGGDYLTLQQHDDKRITLALYDVTGHGVSAAFTANIIHNQLQLILTEPQPTPIIVDRVNRFITKTIGKTNMLATMLLVNVDCDKKQIEITNAGHPDLLLYRKDSHSLESISSHTPLLGMLPSVLGEENESQLPISQGDRIILYTDGFTETCNKQGEMLGREGLKKMIMNHVQSPPPTFIDAMFEDLITYRYGDPDDDLTLMCIDIL